MLAESLSKAELDHLIELGMIEFRRRRKIGEGVRAAAARRREEKETLKESPKLFDSESLAEKLKLA